MDYKHCLFIFFHFFKVICSLLQLLVEDFLVKECCIHSNLLFFWSHWQTVTRQLSRICSDQKAAIVSQISVEVNSVLGPLEVEMSAEAPLAGGPGLSVCVDDFTSRILCCAERFNLTWRGGGDRIPLATELSHTHTSTHMCMCLHTYDNCTWKYNTHGFFSFSETYCKYLWSQVDFGLQMEE